MKIKGLEIEDFVNYKYPSMFIAIGTCDWKCCIEGGFDVSVCHNSPLVHAKEQNISNDFIYTNYITDPITKAVVIGGLEPMTQFEDIYNLIKYFRYHNCEDDFVIYTGYYPHEIISQLYKLNEFDNIIIKFGRYKINDTPKMDKVLGVQLASSNQFACYLNNLIESHKETLDN